MTHVIENSFICDLAIVRLKIKKTVGKKLKKAIYYYTIRISYKCLYLLIE